MRRHLFSLAVSLAAFGLFVQCVSAATSDVLLPTSDGNYLQWTPSTGTTHYTLVDESACNGTTNFNSTNTTGNRDSYGISLASIGDGAIISQIDVMPCASRDSNGNGSSTLDVFYRYNGTNSSDTGSYALSGTTPTDLATSTYSSLTLFKTSTSTLEIGGVFSSGTKGARLSRIATVLRYTLSTPSAPTSLAATNSSSSVNNLSWTDNSNNELGFKVYRALNGGSYTQIATTTLNAVSYSDTGLTADQTYSYYVAAYNSAGTANSNSSTAVTYSTVPAAPSGLTAVLSSGNVVLSWTDNSTNEDGFSIERSTSNNVYSVIATTTLNVASSTSYTDMSVGAGTYYYRVRAFSTVGNSGYSNVASKVDAAGETFATIAFDSASSGMLWAAPGTTLAYSHTTSATGSNRILFVNVETANTSGVSVKYADQDLTLIGSDFDRYNTTPLYDYLYYMVAPATGTNDVVITVPSSDYIHSTAASYTGASQSGVFNYATSHDFGSPLAVSLSTTSDSSWVVMGALDSRSIGSGLGVGSGTTQRAMDGQNSEEFVDGNGPVSPPGSATLNVTGPGTTDHWAAVIASFKPAG